jgi:hypothetical protein
MTIILYDLADRNARLASFRDSLAPLRFTLKTRPR